VFSTRPFIYDLALCSSCTANLTSFIPPNMAIKLGRHVFSKGLQITTQENILTYLLTDQGLTASYLSRINFTFSMKIPCEVLAHTRNVRYSLCTRNLIAAIFTKTSNEQIISISNLRFDQLILRVNNADGIQTVQIRTRCNPDYAP